MLRTGPVFSRLLRLNVYGRALSSTATFEYVKLISADPFVTRLVLNKPEKRNALSMPMMADLLSALKVVRDSTARVLIIESTGKVFSAGHDLSELRGASKDAHKEIFETCSRLMTSLKTLPQPVIASVSGLATAAGCQLVASCDVAIAANTARFATPGVSVGLFCSTPAVPLVRSVGPKRAMRMLLTGEPIDAPTALAWGLITDCVPPEELEAATLALASKIASFPPAVQALGKRAFWSQSGLCEEDAYCIATDAMVANAGQADAQEGFSAFLEKRKPSWGKH